MLILMFLAIFAAAFFNAVMDTLQFHFSTSIFKNLNQNFWNPNVSFKVLKNFLGIVRLDAWHLTKFCLLGSFIAFGYALYFMSHIYPVWALAPAFFAEWFIVFELFFSKIFKRN